MLQALDVLSIAPFLAQLTAPTSVLPFVMRRISPSNRRVSYVPAHIVIVLPESHLMLVGLSMTIGTICIAQIAIRFTIGVRHPCRPSTCQNALFAYARQNRHDPKWFPLRSWWPRLGNVTGHVMSTSDCHSCLGGARARKRGCDSTRASSAARRRHAFLGWAATGCRCLCASSGSVWAFDDH